MLGVLVVLIIAFSVASPYYLTRPNWLNTTSTATEVLLLALGQTFVIVSGGIDLSVGAVLGLSGMTAGWVMVRLAGADLVLVVGAGFAAALAVGLVAGLLNGWLIAYHHLPAFVVTLGMLGVASGLAELLNNGQPLSNIPAWVGTMGNTNLAGWLPIPVVVAAVLCALTGLTLAKTRFGTYTYAVGDNVGAAVRAGIPWQRHLLQIYTLSALLAATDGILVMARLAVASPAAGADDELSAIAAVVIGGASLFGGRGTILGSIIGTLIISVLLTGLIILNVPPYWQLVAVGTVLIAAVFVDQYARRLHPAT